MIQPGNFGGPQSCKTENNLPNVAPSSSHGTGSLSPNLWQQRHMIILKPYKFEESCIPDRVEFFEMDYSSHDLACPLML